MTVFLYEIKRRVELTLRDLGSTVNWNLPMNTNDFRVFQGVHNPIELVVRNTDRKPIDLSGKTLEVSLFDQRIGQLLVKLPVTIINPLKGLCKVDITPDVLQDWFLQTYRYSVSIIGSDGVPQMLFVDQNESASGFFELCQGPEFQPHPSYEIEWDGFFLTGDMKEQSRNSHRYSTAFPGSLQRNNTSGLHTVVIYPQNFSGTLKIQGSVEEGTPSDSDWYDIQELKFYKDSEIQLVNFEANLMWVRFWIHNHLDDLDASDRSLKTNQGKIVKLVFRN